VPDDGMTRRGFVKSAAFLASGLAATGTPAIGPDAAAQTPGKQTVLPRWRGFNLHYFFLSGAPCKPDEEDFQWISELGFNFVRLPMWYDLWTEGGDPYKNKENVLEQIDRSVEMGMKYGIHMCLNFHRAPGYCVANVKEPFNLWIDRTALDAFRFQWGMFAKRYKGIPSSALSFNLVNEPNVPGLVYARVAKAAIEEIRSHSPDRLIISDGIYSSTPVEELAETGVAQSCRGYSPHSVTHYKAGWMAGSEYFEKPRWPGSSFMFKKWDRAALERHYKPWADLAARGIGVHCGECGCHNQTPHDVFMAWFRDVLEILTSHGIGYALWCFKGSFGILDSGRADVEYEDWRGHKLDRKLLNLINEM